MTATIDLSPAPGRYGPYDTELELRDGTAVAITTTTAETGIALAVRSLPTFSAVVNVTAFDHTTGDETYVVSIETDSAIAFGSPVEVGSITVTATGTYEIPLSGPAIAQRDSTAAAIRVKATLGGTTPSLSYGAWLAPDNF